MKNLWQFIKFGLVGVSNTLISEAIYVIIVLLKGNYLFASFMGFAISVLNAYYWSNKYVFKEDEKGEKRIWWKVLLKTYVAYLGGFLVNLCLLIFWIDILHISKYVDPILLFLANLNIHSLDAEVLGNVIAEGVNLLLIIPMNFLINKFWAYKQKERTE